VKDEKSPDAGASSRKRPEHHSGSFLIRVWTEPREVESQEETVRGFLRNLKTGEEQYLNDPQKLGELLLQHLMVEVKGEPGSGEEEEKEEQAGPA